MDRLIEKTVLRENRPLHKDVFSPSCNCLPSHRPLWTDTHPIDVTSQWKNDWKSALVVNSETPLWITPLSGNQLWQYFSKNTNFGLTKVTAHPATESGALQLVISVNVANVKQCFISSTAATDQAGGWPTTASLDWRCCCSMVDVIWIVIHTITTTTMKIWKTIQNVKNRVVWGS